MSSALYSHRSGDSSLPVYRSRKVENTQDDSCLAI